MGLGRNRREQRREDRQEFGRGGSAVRYKMKEKLVPTLIDKACLIKKVLSDGDRT